MPPQFTFPADSPYRRLARSLDALPNRFPPADDESDLRLLARLFTAEEAGLAADLLPELEGPAEIAARLGRDMRAITPLLKGMAQKGLINIGKTAQGRLGFSIMPFVVGFYEEQTGRIDAELARLFEDYYQKVFHTALQIQPQVHRVIPVGVSVRREIEVQPFESVSGMLEKAQSWGVVDCICRTQKALIGQDCGHPRDVCMVLSDQPDAFAHSTLVRALTRAEAAQTLQRAAEAGLVHCISNNQRDTSYICNCCTCSCAVLRGMADLGVANVVARSAFVNRVEAARCIACGVCVTACQFNALSLEDVAQVEETRCVGCGVCVPACPEGALGLERRPGEAAPPVTEADWLAARR